MIGQAVAMISDHASPLATLGGVDAGGQNVYVAQIARQLGAAGHAVDVFTRRDDPALPDVVDLAPGVRVVHVPAGPAAPIAKESLLAYMPAFTAWLRRWLERGHRYDVVHANFFYSGLVAAELRTDPGIPFVVTFHALGRIRRRFHGNDDGFPDARFAIEDRIVAEADRVIAECPQDEADLIELYRADARRISVVPCGVDPDEFPAISRTEARRSLGIEPDPFVLLQLGRVVPRKGIDTVIRAVSELRRRHGVEARLVVVGGADRDPDPVRSPELARLVRLATAEGVADAVTFVGGRDRAELNAFYRAADVFVSTPWYEPFGITPLEAMACGTPVIGSAVGGIKFSVRDGETGYLVPARDHAAVADRAAHLARHPELLAAFGRNGIRRVGERFTWDRVARAVAATYEAALLDARRTRRRAEGPRRTRPAAGSASGLRAAAATRRAPLPHPVQAAAGGPR